MFIQINIVFGVYKNSYAVYYEKIMRRAYFF